MPAGHPHEPARRGDPPPWQPAEKNRSFWEAGCGFALDDFGAGYGSFTYLKHLPFTTVKIAGEFVRQVDDDAVDRALVTAVVGVAHQLGMRTVAEMVDRPTLVTHLRALGVDDGQGFHLGKPRSLDTLLDRI